MVQVNVSSDIYHVSRGVELELVEQEYKRFCKETQVNPRTTEMYISTLVEKIPEFLQRHNFKPDFASMFMTCDKTYVNQIITIIQGNALFQYEDSIGQYSLTKSLEHYLRFLTSEYDPRNDSYRNKNEDEENEKEGRLNEAKVIRRQRNRKVRQQCLDASGYKCYICGFNFEKVYGEIGKGFLEVHHKVPLASYPEEHVIPIEELCALCSNCHSMVHRYRNIIIDVEKLRSELKERGLFNED